MLSTTVIRKGLQLLLLCCFSNAAFSQAAAETPKPDKKVELGLDGTLAVSCSNTTIGINVGGPSLKYRCSKDFRIAVGAFPSLVIVDKRAFPKLGVSPILEYKKWILICPYYGYDTKDRPIWTYGIGYRFY